MLKNKKSPKAKVRIIPKRQWSGIRAKYINAKRNLDNHSQNELIEMYTNPNEPNRMGIFTHFDTEYAYPDQISVINGRKHIARFALFYNKDGLNFKPLNPEDKSIDPVFGISINDDGSGIRFKLVEGIGGNGNAEQYLIPIYPEE